jgi:hypothetical protein
MGDEGEKEIARTL